MNGKDPLRVYPARNSIARTMDETWEFYRDGQGEWRWMTIGPDGGIIRTSEHGYALQTACEDNARKHGWNG